MDLPKELRVGPAEDPFRALDCPEIGGKFTVCVLTYGPFPELAQRCLDSLRGSLPDERMDLRVACNQVVDETRRYLDTLPITKLYPDDGERRKYPAMREMFYDPECPITTPYVIWLDDDVWVVKPQWVQHLAQAIKDNHSQRVGLYGWRMLHDTRIFRKFGHDPLQWFREARWWRGRNLRTREQDREDPTGTCLHFVVGWFWAAKMAAIREADVPDVRLNHNGGDCTIGEQMHQAGYGIKMFNERKMYLTCPPKQAGGRRPGGFHEPFPWSHTAAGLPHAQEVTFKT